MQPMCPAARAPAQNFHREKAHMMDMSTFVTAAAHDMKNSVSVIMAFLEDALAQLGTEGQASNASASARTLTHQALYEAQRLNGHLIQIMGVYKIDQGLFPFDPEEVDLPSFAEEAAARVRPLAAIRGIDLDVRIAPRASYGFFDRELILSVVVQSLYNAIKYTKDRIGLFIHQHDNELEMRVEDNGKGFPPFMLERGYAERQTINTRTGSTGLGLLFSRQAAELHRNGNQIGSTRLENGGTLRGGCFVLTLP
jgi:signal transduction histidine kinase